MTAHTTRQHISRAVLEAVCFQVAEIFRAMVADSGCEPKQFLVDGGDITVYRSKIDEKERERKTKRWKMAVERSLGWDLEAMSTDD